MNGDQPRLNVFNRQRKVPVDCRTLAGFVAELGTRLGLTMGVSVILVSDRAMRRLNRQFAGQDRTTDVLSFPTDPADRNQDPYLGDVFISLETADRQRQGTLEHELRALTLHGVLHLLGYDHAADQGEMESFERKLRAEMGIV